MHSQRFGEPREHEPDDVRNNVPRPSWRTALNAAGVLRGRLDPPLDDVGEHQARALGALFADVSVAAVVSSPLQRASQTAQPIADATGAPLVCDDAFVDRDYGP